MPSLAPREWLVALLVAGCGGASQWRWLEVRLRGRVDLGSSSSRLHVTSARSIPPQQRTLRICYKLLVVMALSDLAPGVLERGSTMPMCDKVIIRILLLA